MIISHTHKYLFIELPMTGSTAISKELREQYDGVSILQKHSTYLDFLRVANEAEKQYFVFAGIRHPLDQVVSHYFKFKTGHDGQFTAAEHLDKLREKLALPPCLRLQPHGALPLYSRARCRFCHIFSKILPRSLQQLEQHGASPL